MKKKVWVYKDADERKAQKLAEDARISGMLAKVFVSRGIDDPDEVRRFLNPELSGLHDPFLMDGMDTAVDRILQAVENCEEILVYGDYDVDGVSGTSILFSFLTSIGAKVQYFLPDRMEDGYGLTMTAIEKVKMLNASLVVTVDCGITSVDEIDHLQKAGLQVIVTDHHECKELLPDAYAVLNPHKPGCGYPFKELCGASVALKLIHGLCIRLGRSDEFMKYLDLAALATIADVVPLQGENRIIASFGLKAMETTQNLGLRALINIAGMSGKPITSYGAAFGLAPRVNAAGRLGDSRRGVRLFTANDQVLAEAMAKELDTENRNRQETEAGILEEAFAYVEENLDPVSQKVLVVVGEGWHHGVIGIVASKVLERYYRPCIVISVEDGVGKGSGRSVKGFNLFSALCLCEELLDRFGGHEMAAGLTMQADKVEELRTRINDHADSVLTEDDLVPHVRVDAILEQGEITLDDVRELAGMAPFGEANPNPRFAYMALGVMDIKTMSGGKHLKLKLADGGFNVEAVGFGMGEFAQELKKGDVIDVAFAPDINAWNGNERLQLILNDIRPCVYAEFDKNIVFADVNDYNSYINLKGLCRLLEDCHMTVSELVPGRAELEATYKYLRMCARTWKEQPMPNDLFGLSANISEKYGVRVNFLRLKRALEIFDEIGLIEIKSVDWKTADIKVLDCTQKVDLESSRCYQMLQELKEGIS